MTAAALEFALASAGLSLTSAQRRHLVERYDHLPPLADAAPALRALAQCGFELVVLSNGTPDMIAACLAQQRPGRLDLPAAQRGRRPRLQAASGGVPIRGAAPGTACRQLRLVSGNAFDIVGAGAAGVRTAWVNRVGAPFDTIGKSPEIIVSDLGRLPDALAG